MADFNFMSSGLGDIDGGAYEENFKEHMTAVLSLFISKALEDSVKYIDICKRNGVTKEDIEMALKYQTFKFFQNPNLNSELEEVKQDIKQELEEGDEYYYEYESGGEGEGSGEEEGAVGEESGGEGSGEEEGAVGEESGGEDSGEDSEMDFNDIFGHLIKGDGEVQEFTRANLREVEVEDRNFIQDVHRCYDSWDNWVPRNDMEKALFNAIESMTAHF